MVHRNLATRRATLVEAARELGIHERTLQRHLKAHSILFKDLVERVRCQLAREYLAASNLSLLQIASSLGYTEQSSFNRACHRWFATSPLAFRRQPAPDPQALKR